MRLVGTISVAIGLLLGCTAPNPGYLGGEGDLRTLPGDLSRPPDAPVDPNSCRAGERGCRNGGQVWISQLCRDNKWQDDRRCPTNSSCAAGYCQPPPPQGMFEGRPCSRENDCFSPLPSSEYSCQPFVRVPGLQVDGYCALRVGTGNPGTLCKPPDGRGCRTGFCDEIARANSNYCYRTCSVAADCPSAGRWTCSEARITVEQVVHNRGKSCIPVI